VQEEEKSRQDSGQENPEEDGTAEKEAEAEAEQPEATDEGAEEGQYPELEEDWAGNGRTSRRSGCLWGCLMPIAAVVAVLMIVGIVVYSKRDTISSWLLVRILANTQNHVLSELPEDMDSEAIKADFEKVKSALKAKKMDEDALTKAIEEYQEATRHKLPQTKKKDAISKLMEGMNAAIISGEQ